MKNILRKVKYQAS